jgi:hypothetical protein
MKLTIYLEDSVVEMLERESFWQCTGISKLIEGMLIKRYEDPRLKLFLRPIPLLIGENREENPNHSAIKSSPQKSPKSAD